MIAESYTELEAARLLLMNAAFKKENGKFFAREASMAKYYATEAAERACHKAIRCWAATATPTSSRGALRPRRADHLDLRGHQPGPAPHHRQGHPEQLK